MTTCLNKFTLIPANNFIWNHNQLLKFLIEQQGSPIEICTHNEGVCLRTSGVYQLLEKFGYNEVKIDTNNLLEKHNRFEINIINPFKFFNLVHNNYNQYHSWNKTKIFACLYNRPLWHRLGLAAEMQSRYEHISIINMRANPHNIDQRQLFEVQTLFENSPDSFKKFAEVKTTWPRQLEKQDGYTVGNTTNGHTDQLSEFYSNFLIDIVAETWTQGNTFFPTEKTVRPILLKKPFIVFGPQDYLLYLRQMGFRTFENFWSEEYDGYSEVERYTRILELIDSVATKSFSDLEKMYWDMQYTLDHNYNLLVSGQFNKIITPLL
jgi:hypothetical protein